MIQVTPQALQNCSKMVQIGQKSPFSPHPPGDLQNAAIAAATIAALPPPLPLLPP